MTNKPEPRKYDALIWDIDGLIIDVSNSYFEAVKRTVKMFTVKNEITDQDIKQIQDLPGITTFFDITYVLIQQINDNHFEIDHFIAEQRYIQNSLKYKKIKNVFQSFYLGHDLYYEFYGKEPSLNIEVGLINNETALLTRSDLKELLAIYGKMAIVTSRQRFETEHTLLVNHVRDLFSVIVCFNETELHKPKGEPVKRALKLLKCTKPLMFCGNINDFLAAKAAAVSTVYIEKDSLIDFQVGNLMDAFNKLSYRDRKDYDLIDIEEGQSKLLEYTGSNHNEKNVNSHAFFSNQAQTQQIAIPELEENELTDLQKVVEIEPEMPQDLEILENLSSSLNESRQLSENTNIQVHLNLYGRGSGEIRTGVSYINKMLGIFTSSGLFDLDLYLDRGLYNDEYSLIQGLGAKLGSAFQDAISLKENIKKSGFCILPVDQCLVSAVIDFSGRYSFKLSTEFQHEQVANLNTDLVSNFWDAFARGSNASIIIKTEFDANDYEKIQGIFTATAKAIKIACQEEIVN